MFLSRFEYHIFHVLYPFVTPSYLCLDQDSSLAPPEYKSRVLLLHSSARSVHGFVYVVCAAYI
jgi:hypothetical protein